MSSEATVVDNKSASRFEVTVDGSTAHLVYRIDGERLVLVHTEVPDEVEGHGIGGLLVKSAVERAVDDGLVVVLQCPFARAWLERHPDAAAKVTIEESPNGASGTNAGR